MPYRSRGERRRPGRHERPLVFAGAISLAAIAGYINVVVLGVFHVPVSHMTGAVSRLSIDVAAGDQADLRVVSSIVGAFFVGAAISGAIIGGRKLVPGRRYGVALLAEGAALGVSALLLAQGSRAGVTLAALACGIQNAMASSYFGLILRTTHVTGIVTDLGVIAGHWVRHRRVHPWKPILLASILLFFFGGGVAGHFMFQMLETAALSLAAAGCLLAGAVYYVWRHYRTGRTTLAMLLLGAALPCVWASSAAGQDAGELILGSGGGVTYYCIDTRCNAGTILGLSTGYQFSPGVGVDIGARLHQCFDCDQFLIGDAAVLIQYPRARVRPYAGAGIGYSSDPGFMGSHIGGLAAVGVSSAIAGQWGLRADLRARSVGSGSMGELTLWLHYRLSKQ